MADKTTRAECGQTALVGQPVRGFVWSMNCDSCEEPKNSLMAATMGRMLISDCGVISSMLLGAHALTDDALHTAHADAELVLDELANGADAAVAEVVDVVDLEALLAGSEGQQVAQRRDDILVGERRGLFLGGEVELLVDLVTADAGQVVALRVKEQTLEQLREESTVGGSPGRQTTVELDEGVLASEGGVALQGALDYIGVTEELDDVIAVTAMPRARRNIVALCLRLRSMETMSWSRLSASNSSQAPRDGMIFAL